MKNKSITEFSSNISAISILQQSDCWTYWDREDISSSPTMLLLAANI